MDIRLERPDYIVNSTSNVTVEELLERISREYENLSRTLKVIALYIEKHRDRLGLMGIQTLAAECDVQPSAVVRFAKHFGFSGFVELQRVFRDGLARQIAASGTYSSRMRELIDSGSGGLSPINIAREYLTGSMAGMQELRDGLQASSFETAVELLANADSIWIAGSRRSFPIAVYLEYALQHTDRRVGLISALGSMHLGQMNSLRKGDVMIAISYTP
jgi:DNA-binding MurR/RpiR family transcriptional regulator